MPLVAALSLLLLVGVFSRELSDTDFWWHLRSGQYIVETHRLPAPDPFAYTTATARDAYAGESVTRRFNLTHEWLSQSLLYLLYRATGAPGVVIFRTLLLAGFCALVGLVAWKRRGETYMAIAAALAAAAVAAEFTNDRPYLVTFFLLALTVALLEWRWRLWLLPPLFLFWANCHGGFFLGWIAVAAYAFEAALARWRGRSTPEDRTLWLAGAAAVLASGLNPNGFRVLQVLFYYRSSTMQSRLLEWGSPQLWPPTAFSALLVLAAALLIWRRRKVRVADWALFAAFALAALTAQRNVILIGFLAPILIAVYLPWKPRFPAFVPFTGATLLVAALAIGIAQGRFFQFRAADWKFPSGAADFLLAHHITAPMFNTYEYGGYLIWRLWPRERVFIDGRALSESVFADYGRILYNHDASGGEDAQQLLDRYGVQVIVMNSFEYVNGLTYLLAPSLGDPAQSTWKLVYSDAQALVFMRHPPEGVTPRPPLDVFSHLEDECSLHIEHQPEYPRCARALGQIFSKMSAWSRARRWIGIYLDHPHPPDPQAENAYRRLVLGGK